LKAKLIVLWYKWTCRRWQECIDTLYHMELFISMPECKRTKCPAYKLYKVTKAYQTTVKECYSDEQTHKQEWEEIVK